MGGNGDGKAEGLGLEGVVLVARHGDEAGLIEVREEVRVLHGRVELHEMSMDGAVMRMRKVDVLAIPAHGEAALAPSARHLMFFGVSQPFVQGEQIPVTLTFAHAREVNTVLMVRRGGQHTH